VKIALVHYAVPPVVGGVESVIARHAELMRAAGHVVQLIAARGESQAPDITLARLPLVDSRHPRVLAVKAQLDRGCLPTEFDKLKADIIANLREVLRGTDLLIAHNVCSLAKNLALTAALHELNGGLGMPRMVLWHHDLAWTTPRYTHELHDGYPWDLLRTHWPGVRQVVVSDQRQRELAELTGLPPHHISVVPNGIDAAEFFKLEPQTATLAAAMGLYDIHPLLLLPVRLTPRKNIELALQALSALRRLPNQTEFALAGLLVTGPEGPHNPANVQYRQRLFELRDSLGLRGSAHFAAEHSSDFLPDAVVADFYRLADALILPSREEGFGIPLIEAALARLPVFCTDIAPLRALGRDDASYFSADASPESVARLIAARLAADPVYNFATRARSNYTWRGIYARHIAPLLEASAIG
jgi:mannosylglucosylglycerate synthase